MNSKTFFAYLDSQYEQRKLKNSRYSFRAFARLIGLDSSTFIALRKGRRKLGVKTALQILDRLGEKNSLIRRSLLLSVAEGKPAENPYKVQLVKPHVAETWEFAPIFVILQGSGKSHVDMTQISQRLKITPKRTALVLRRMERAGLIEFSKDKIALKTSVSHEVTSDEKTAAQTKKLHVEVLKKAIQSMDRDEPDHRELNTLAFCCSTKKLPLAKKMIDDFRYHLAQLMEGSGDEPVYELCIQLFPVASGKS